jgi:hypothetical protein
MTFRTVLTIALATFMAPATAGATPVAVFPTDSIAANTGYFQ